MCGACGAWYVVCGVVVQCCLADVRARERSVLYQVVWFPVASRHRFVLLGRALNVACVVRLCARVSVCLCVSYVTECPPRINEGTRFIDKLVAQKD